MVTMFARPSLEVVKHLLAGADLSSADMTPAHLAQFYGCGPEDKPDGIVGMEIYGDVALLRSLTVAAPRRRIGLGTALVEHAEQEALRQGVSTVYLLTTTAESLFLRLDYARVPREQAPSAIRATREFSDMCPASAAFMMKQLAGRRSRD